MTEAEHVPVEFGEILRARRDEMTLAHLSMRVHGLGENVSQQKLSAWERGEYRPKSINEVRAVEAALNCPGVLLRALGWDDDSRIAAVEARLEAVVRALQAHLPGALDDLDDPDVPK